MNPRLDHMPRALAMAAASLGGYRLRFRRYPRDLESRVERVLDRDRWDDQQWRNFQQGKLDSLLRWCRDSVPYYREAPDGGLDTWPILQKDSLRTEPRRLLSSLLPSSKLIEVHTSGSTGTPLTVWRSLESERAWYALFEARVRRWHGVSHRDRWAIFGGRAVAPARQRRPPYWLWNAGLRQLYCSSYHVGPDSARGYFDALRRYRITYVVGYPSALASLARAALDQSISPPDLKVVIANGELLPDRDREAIEGAFGCPVRNTYGMAEMVAAASECEFGRMHLWPEAGVVEILGMDSDRQLENGESGRLVATGLLNLAMPLVRYEIGDRASLVPSSEACSCGRSLPILGEIDGRLDDVIVTPDGREIGRVDPLFKGVSGVREAQVVQSAPDELTIRISPAADYTTTDGEKLVAAFHDRLGTMDIKLETVDRIDRGPNGKFKGVVSLLR